MILARLGLNILARGHRGVIARLVTALFFACALLGPARSFAADISPLNSQSRNALAAASRCQSVPPGGVRRKDGEVLFSAQNLTYNEATQVAIADGHVEAAFYSCVLIADHVEYDLKNNIVRAKGNIAILEPSGTAVFANSLELSGGLEARPGDGLLSGPW